METEDLLERLDEIDARMRATTESLKRGLVEQGQEMHEGFAETREAIQALARAQERQEARFTAWLEGLEARLDAYQDSTSESLQMVGGIVRTWLNRQEQEAQEMRIELRDHEARLRALEGRDPAA